MWQEFALTGEASSQSFRTWYFGDNQTDADELVALVLAGTKRGTANPLWTHEADGPPVPEPGDLSVVTDWEGTAQCIIRTTAVDVIPYNQVSAVFAAIEGEGDRSLAYWKAVHWPYFQREMNRLGRPLSETIPIVCHQFEVAFP